MQPNGALRRPLWDVIKSIGGHGRAQRQAPGQWRGLHIQNVHSGFDSPSPRPNERGVEAARKSDWKDVSRRFVPFRDRVGVEPTQQQQDGHGHDGRIRRIWARTPGLEVPGARQDKAEGAVAQEEPEAPFQAPASIPHIAPHDSQAQEGGQDREAGTAQQNANVFESVVQDATAGPVDSKLHRRPKYKREKRLKPRYFKAYEQSKENRLMRQVRRWQNQRERYGLESARNWRSALDLLDQATPDGQTRHKRRIETVMLPQGVRARWRKSSGEVIAELMQRTGAHLQALPGFAENGTFDAVSLWGTPAQNEHARLLLPQYVDAVTEQNKAVSEYELRSSVDSNSPDAQHLFGASRKGRTGEDEDMDVLEQEMLVGVLGDITGAPRPEPAPVRAVWAPSAVRFRSRPAQWNQLTFTAYIDALTSPMPRLAQRKLFGPQSPQHTEGHVEKMTAELVRTFSSRQSGPYASNAALNTALAWLIKYNDFPAIRRIFITLEDRYFEFTASNFDALFDAAAREESIPNFIYTLRLMIQKGMRPSTRTWTAFHLLISRRFPLEANVVTETMRRKGLLANPDTVRAIAAGNADRAIAAHLSVGKSVHDFFLSCEAYFGEPSIWLSSRFANKVARVLLEHGRREEAFDFVRQLEALARAKGRQGVKTNTLNTFLASTMRGDDLEGALACMRIFVPPSPSAQDRTTDMAPIGRTADDPLAIQPDQVTFAILFAQAWAHRHYNVLRVVWRHACAAGYVAFNTQTKVRISLKYELRWDWLDSMKGDLRMDQTKRNIRPIPNLLLFNALAGKFITGLSAELPKNGDVANPRQTGHKPVSTEVKDDVSVDKELLDPIIQEHDTGHVSGNQPEDDTPTALGLVANRFSFRQRTHKARTLLEADLAETGSLRPANHIVDDLERAWRLDVLWKEEGLGEVSRVMEAVRADGEASPMEVVVGMFKEMLARGVRVPMVVGDVAGVRANKGLIDVHRHR